MVMTRALVNFSPWMRICNWLELRGKRDGKLCSSGEVDRICLYVEGFACMHVCVTPPMIVGAWSMAVVLWQLLEYYLASGSEPTHQSCQRADFSIYDGHCSTQSDWLI